ncbi:HAMP domain-containing sensor histidine kinase [Corallincola platygyrae]|uniref:histidine kinase n=1 Tax=Corallincola platygyrae TaxID=1193278 RepID=A0ABW4XKF9_9GAMM
MKQENQKQPHLSRTLVIVIAAFALIPALILSGAFVYTLNKTLIEDSELQAELQAKAVGDLVVSVFDRLMEDLVDVAADHNVAQSARSGAFSGYATDLLQRRIIRSREGIGAVIFDRNLTVAEAEPVELLLNDYSIFDNQIAGFLRRNSVIKEPAPIELVYEDSEELNLEQEPGAPKDQLAFITPLHLPTLIEAPASTLTGALLVIVDRKALVENIRKDLGSAALLSIKLGGKDIFSSSKQRKDFSTFTFTEQLNTGLEISVEVGVPLEIVQNRVNETIRHLILMLCSSLLALLFLSIAVAKRLLTPFRQLSRLVARISLGEYSQSSMDVKFKEPAQLLALVNRLTSRVIEDQAELESKVMERTELLRSTNDELSDTLDQLTQLQSHLVESETNAQLGQLVAGVAHEINTPLGISLTATTTLIDDLKKIRAIFDSNKLKRSDLEKHFALSDEALTLLEYNLNRGAELVRTFKEVSVDQSSGQRREFLLKSYLEEVVASLKAETKRHNIEFRISGDDKLSIDSYPGAYSHIFSNFILNSLKHGFTEAARSYLIAISFVLDGDLLHIEYTDNGTGMSDDVLDKMFKPFFTTGRNAGCTGLGMHIVYNMVTQRLGGTIRASHNVGRGACFHLIVPLVAPEHKN